MEATRLPKPSQTLTYVIVWRNYGVYRIKAFATFREAYTTFNELKVLARVALPIDTDFAVYILYWFAGYSYGD